MYPYKDGEPSDTSDDLTELLLEDVLAEDQLHMKLPLIADKLSVRGQVVCRGAILHSW